jgi:hypothetical protein
MLGMSEANTPRRPARGSFVVLVTLVVLWLIWLGWFLLAPDRNPGGQCEGLGFGCTLTPQDLAEFAGIILLAPFTVLVIAVTAVVRLVRIGKGSARTGWDLTLGGLLAAAVLTWIAGMVLGAF